jgi:hypothetical protein
MCVSMWAWLVRGVPPKAQLHTALRKLDTVMRKLRACVPVSWSRRTKAAVRRVVAISGSVLLQEELAVSGGLVSLKPSKAHKEERLSLLAQV